MRGRKRNVCMRRKLARRASLCERKNGNANLRISYNVGKQIRTSPASISGDAPDGSENHPGLAHRPPLRPRIGDSTKTKRLHCRTNRCGGAWPSARNQGDAPSNQGDAHFGTGLTHVFGPNGGLDLADMRFLQVIHAEPTLSDAAAHTQGQRSFE